MGELGTEIRVARIRAGLSQLDLANLIYRDQSVISDYERGVSIPPLETLTKIAQITGCEELLGDARQDIIQL